MFEQCGCRHLDTAVNQKRLSRSKTKAGRNVATCSGPTLLFARLIAFSLRCFAQSLPLRYAAVPCRKVSTSSVKANALSCITTKAMKNYWKTSTSGSITLKKENPEVFEVYLNGCTVKHSLSTMTVLGKKGTLNTYNLQKYMY